MAAGIMTTACSNEDFTPSNEGGRNDATIVSDFSGNIGNELDVLDTEGFDGDMANNTRSTITNGEFSSWSTTDIVSISDGTLSYKYKPTTINGTRCEFGVVDGKNQFDKDLTGNENFYVFYPAAAVSGWNGAKVTSMVYAQQDYTENVDNGAMGAYMATKAKVNEDKHVSFDFNHCCSVVEVNLSTLGVTPKSVSLRSNSGVDLAGKIVYDIDNNTITVSANDATDYSYSTRSEVINMQNVAADAKTARFYVLPVIMKGGVTVTIEDTDGNFYTKSTSTDIGNASETIKVKGPDGKDLAGAAAKPYYKKVNFGAATAARKGNWMSTIPGNTWLHGLSIPGAHDAATYNTSTSSAQCQSKNINEQLEAGVRAFDIRVPYIGLSNAPTTATVSIYHGIVNTKVLFKDAMDYLVSYVKKNPTETIIVVVNKENSKPKSLITIGNKSKDYSQDDNGCAWQKSIRDYVDGTYKDASTVDASITGSRAGYFITDISQPLRLSSCRGKILFLTRNYYGTSQSATSPVYGGVIRNWEDNTIFDATIYKTNAASVCGIHIQDNYSQSNYNTKQNNIKECLEKSAADFTNKFYFNFVSMVKETGASPKDAAKTMNPATVNLLANVSGKTGVMFYDYCMDKNCGGIDLQKAILNQNYKYVFGKRTRVSASKGNGTGVGIAGDEYADGSNVFAKPHKNF